MYLNMALKKLRLEHIVNRENNIKMLVHLKVLIRYILRQILIIIYFNFKTQWHSETATITTWGDGIWSSTTSTGFTTQNV